MTGGVSLELDYDRVKQTLLVRVIDTGIGISENELPNIFTEYAQASPETKRRFGGTGLGLSISRRLIVGMGGAIAVETEPGKGSTFTIDLPCVHTAKQAKKIQPLLGRIYRVAMPEGPTARHLMLTLTDLGAIVKPLKTASELKAALTARASAQGVVIICDASFTRELRQWARQQKRKRDYSKQVWVVMQAEQRRSLRDLLQQPFSGYLLKPFRKATLKAQLTSHEVEMLRGAANALRRAARLPLRPRRLRIILAEDNMINALLARTMLEKAGHSVHHVTSGMAFLAAIEQHEPFDLAIMDVEMPNLDGLATTRKLREQEAEDRTKNRLPVLALTANVRRENYDECLAAGMNGHLAKPFDREDLEEAVARLTRNKHAA
jgi:CheY-like chemotaxis protein